MSGIFILSRRASLIVLNVATALVLLGGCFDMVLPFVPSNLLAYLAIDRAEAPVQLSALLLGLLRALGGCLVAIGGVGLILINGPIKRGEPWASWALLLLIGISETINASQMWRFGSPYYIPLGFVILTIIGLKGFLVGRRSVCP